MATVPRVSVVVPAFQNAAYIRATVALRPGADLPGLRARRRRPQLHGRHLGDPAGARRRPASPVAAHTRGRRGRAQLEPGHPGGAGELVKLVCGDDLLAPEALEKQVATFDAHDTTGDNSHGGEVVMVASARDIVDASGRVVVRGHGLGGLSGRVPGREAVRRSVLRGANIFGEPGCVLLRRSVLEAVGGWHGDPGYLIDQSTYCRVLLHGDLAWHRNAGRLPAQLDPVERRPGPRTGSLGRRVHRQLAELAPGLLSSRDIRVATRAPGCGPSSAGWSTSTSDGGCSLRRRCPESGRLARQQAELVVDERLPGPPGEREAEPRLGCRPTSRPAGELGPVANHVRRVAGVAALLRADEEDLAARPRYGR